MLQSLLFPTNCIHLDKELSEQFKMLNEKASDQIKTRN